MQSWQFKTSQCIFCSSRLSYKATPRPLTNLWSSPRLFTQSFHQSQRSNSDTDKQTSKRILSRQNDGVRRRRNGEKKSYKPFKPENLPAEQISLRIIQALTSLEKTLSTLEETEENKTTLLMQLDPDGVHWNRFESDVKSLVQTPKDQDVSDERKSLQTQLMTALGKSNWLENTSRILNFAFLDQTITTENIKSTIYTRSAVDLRFPTEWYTRARATQREIHLHVGPTNSGKTYNALKRLEDSGNGFYAGPLRLLAHEVYSRFRAKGVPCDLVTGDDVRYDENDEAKLSASTVEMVDVSREVEVAVIDEIQMMAAEDRGWAWTRAFLGANAKEVHVCGEVRVVPLIRELAASMGDTLHIHQYDRLNPLKAMSRSLRGNLKNLRKGDCVVSFSIMGIHALKRQIELDTGRRVAIVYGSLPPETRAQQAALFNDPDNDYDFLVASDAIGMGLNLSIKRIVFESASKFNGWRREQLSISQIKQIGGRAGRFRSANQVVSKEEAIDSIKIKSTANHIPATIGLVTCLDDADLPVIQEALRSEAPPVTAAGLLPPINFVEDYAARLPAGVPFEYVMRRLRDIAAIHPRFKLCNIEDQLAIVKAIEHVRGLSIAQRCMFAASPAHVNNAESVKVLIGLAKSVAAQKSVTIVDIPEIPLEVLEKPLSGDRLYLEGLERLHRSLILYLWLSYRFLSTFKDRDMAIHAKELTEERINACLLEFSANPLLRNRMISMKQSTFGTKFPDKTGRTLRTDPNKSSHKSSSETNAFTINWVKKASRVNNSRA